MKHIWIIKAETETAKKIINDMIELGCDLQIKVLEGDLNIRVQTDERGDEYMKNLLEEV